jgi:hypothetical protein
MEGLRYLDEKLFWKYDIHFLETDMNISSAISKERILLVIDQLSRESGKKAVLIEEVYEKLVQDHKLDRVSAGKLIVQLLKERRLYSPQYYFIERTQK